MERTSLVQDKTFCEFFAGIGLVREGLKASGWSCVYANDIEPKKKAMYDARFGEDGHFHLGDVWNTDEAARRIGSRPFLATASFPCVDLSLAGRWRGFEGDHSSTFFGFARVLDALSERRPLMTMLENVPGFLTSRDGADFRAAVGALAEMDYWVDAFLVDAKHFVPQSRPRVFVVGLHESLRSPLIRRAGTPGWVEDAWSALIRSSGSLRPKNLARLMTEIVPPTGWATIDLRPPRNQRADLADLIDAGEDQEWWDDAEVGKHRRMMSGLHQLLVDDLLKGGKHVGTIYRRIRAGEYRAEVRFDGMAGCLRTPRGGSGRQIVVVVEDGRIRMRWMSPREYARLQGVGDFPLATRTNHSLLGFGDAVCVPVIRWIDEHYLTPIFETSVASTNGPRHLSAPE